MALRGIDVSLWQKDIDWAQVKASGIDFAFIKSSQGGSTSESVVDPFTDPYFKRNIIAAYNAGIACGVYHYMTGITQGDVVKEANYLIRILEDYRDKITYPVAIDIEAPRYTSLSKELNSELVRIFAGIVKSAVYTPIIYSYKSFLNSYVDLSLLQDIDIWIAVWYKDGTYSDPPKGYPKMTAWQYSDKGAIPGISGNVDLNIAYKDYAFVPQKGDVNADGVIDAKDYLYVKKAVLGTIKLSDDQEFRADINNDGKVDAKDYLGIKKSALGTYKIQN